MSDLNQIKRADRAESILNDPLIREALSHWEQEITEAWKNSSLSDADAHRNLRCLLEASKRFQRYLDTAIQTGKLIRARPTKSEQAKEKVMEILGRR